MSADDAAHGPSHLIQPAPPVSTNTGAKQSDLSQSSLSPPVKSLDYWELVAVCQALGGTPGRTPDKFTSNSTGSTNPSNSVDEKHLSVRIQSDDEEKQLKFAPTVPPPSGLYKNVIDKRKASWWKYQILVFAYNACLVLQLLLGATLTVLGASDKKKSTAITIIAAANTFVFFVSFFPNAVRQRRD
jgi:hypothetical protein